jgi:hypothetical protein
MTKKQKTVICDIITTAVFAVILYGVYVFVAVMN